MYKMFVGNPEEKRPHNRSRCTWLIEVCLREIPLVGLDPSGLEYSILAVSCEQ